MLIFRRYHRNGSPEHTPYTGVLGTSSGLEILGRLFKNEKASIRLLCQEAAPVREYDDRTYEEHIVCHRGKDDYET